MKDLNLFGEDITEFELLEDSEDQFREYEQVQNTSVTTALGILSLFDTTKEQRRSFVDQVVESVTSGLKNPLDIQVQIKCMEDILKGITENNNYKSALVSEAEKYGSKPFDYHNSTIQVKEASQKYDYTNTGDNEIIELERIAKEADKKLKDRQKYLQALPNEGVEIIDKTSGEVVRVFKPSKTSTTTIAVSLK